MCSKEEKNLCKTGKINMLVHRGGTILVVITII